MVLEGTEKQPIRKMQDNSQAMFALLFKLNDMCDGFMPRRVRVKATGTHM